ncbi:MAG TPA: MFS transporter, partial [Mycobacteriales bacterium]|nr:MFS transporter [Mycobacteriales bacterium]
MAGDGDDGLKLREQRAFTTLFLGATLSRLATEMNSVAVVLFVLAETHSAQIAGLTIAAATLPTVVTGPLAGVWLDRSPRRRAVFLASPLVLIAAMVGFLAAGNRAPAGVLIALGFVAGLPSPVRTGGFSGLIPTVVPEPILPRAYGYEAMSYNIAGIAGPAIAGAIAGASGAAWAIAATAIVALISAVVIARVPIVPLETEQRDVVAALRAGLALLWRVRPLRSVTVATTVSQLWFGLLVLAFPLLAHELGYARAVGGLMFSVFAVGALVGSLIYSRVAGRVPEEPAAMVGFCLFAVTLVAIAVAPTLPLALTAAAVAGLFDGPLLAATLNLRQRWAPDWLRTQVFTTAASLKIGAFAVGSALAGPAASAVGAR